MGLRFRKSIKIAPGIKLNFNKKSTGITFGGKGVHYTINSKGKRTTSVGVPGTGLYYTTSSKKSSALNNKAGGNEKEIKIMNSTKWYSKSWAIVLFLIIFFPVGLYLMWRYASWSKLAKIIITAFFALLVIFSTGSEDNEDMTVNGSDAVTTTQGSIEFSEENTTHSNIEVTTQMNELVESESNAETTTEAELTTRQGATTEKGTTTQKETTTEAVTTTKPEPATEKEDVEMVWIPESGKKYHSYSSCSGMKNPSQVTLNSAEKMGYTACKRCH